MPSIVYLRIVILNVEPEAWCDTCGIPSASKVTYAVEPVSGPFFLRLLTYCEACEGA